MIPPVPVWWMPFLLASTTFHLFNHIFGIKVLFRATLSLWIFWVRAALFGIPGQQAASHGNHKIRYSTSLTRAWRDRDLMSERVLLQSEKENSLLEKRVFYFDSSISFPESWRKRKRTLSRGVSNMFKCSWTTSSKSRCSLKIAAK